jgi:7-alpha-hydroxysteroid dehydrogenase
VVNISSRMDRLVSHQMVIYATVKAALSHLTRLLAVELAPNVRVNAIAPSVVDTDGLSTVADVANTARWLAILEAAPGSLTPVDAGALASPTVCPAGRPRR